MGVRYLHEHQGDSVVIGNLHEHLIKAFEEFAEGMVKSHPEEGLRYIDALMGCHNFYKRIILDLEERNPGCGDLYRNIAVTTLADALGRRK